MKTVVIALLLLIASYCIDAKCPKCNADSCLGCTKYSNCVWCDSICQSKFSKIACLSRITAPENCAPGCDYNGKHYSIGDDFMDDCNTCSCNEDGSVICTLMACTPGCEAALCPVDTYCEEDEAGNPICKPLETCDYNGVTYNDGDSFPSTDGCNQCSCTNGRVICTLRFCQACKTNDDCESGFYCKKDSCDDTQSGSCSVRIEFCPEEHDQVCGCDGQTYPNGCVAASSGVNIKSEGPCEGGSQGDCQSVDDCESGKYCKKDSCDDSLKGSCSELSVFCTEQYDPVCGCDGKTYGNDCEAAGAGVNVDSKGECEGGSQGDCSSNYDCDSGYYCAKNSCDDTNGTCTQNTDLCNTLYDPVCGCDGHTYGNGCEAANAGVNVKSTGECEGSQETCKTNDDCDTNHYCKKDSCDDTLEGTCDQRTLFCNKIYSPVCGCDGQTYGNGCEAAGAGVNIKSKGECEGGSQGDCSSNYDCDSGYYCAKNSCNDTDGTCTQNSNLCNTLYDPVCGCDGHTYGNGCEAASAGVNVDSKGECKGGSGTCHTNNDCESGYYCEKDSCGYDAQGYCTENFDVCADISNPVCGCDGKTYGNSCEAASGGVNVDYEGECEGGSQGNCQSNNYCDSGYYCAKSSCGDTYGTCTQNTDLCNTLYDPVCGCDGHTYGNGCEAASAGVNVKSNGECEGGSQGDCEANDDCDSGYYCAKPACDSADGTCTQKMDLCTALYDPVCGCDNHTYGNSCSANNAGVNVKSKGECPKKQNGGHMKTDTSHHG